MFENRHIYRRRVDRPGLLPFSVTCCQTNLQILAEHNLQKQATEQLLCHRGYIESYISQYPEFATTLAPFPSKGPAPKIIRDMIAASRDAGVGPMASVAGALAEYVGRELLAFSSEIIIENGGDIFIRTKRPVTIGIYAGTSPLSMKIGLVMDRKNRPFSVCTSSGTVGHSLSFGSSDAVCIVSDSALLADAAATSIGNRVSMEKDIDSAIAFGKSIRGVQGIVIIVGSKVGLWGDVELVSLSKKA
ncbi:MAG: UPF0280 family protein [Proteobacteria bacterium]|nr:UPF0280 family protein [Pseudomonadota bacterium]